MTFLDTEPPAEAPAPKRSFVRRHKALTVLIILLLLLLGMVACSAWYVNSTLSGIDRFHSSLTPQQRIPRPTTGPAAKAQNILLLGTDKGIGNETIEEELADGKWTKGAFRSDTMMVLHITADRDRAYLISIPRDSYVDIPGYPKQKINAAFSFGGPDLALRTVEQYTGVYIDHVAMIDWAGFKDLTTAIGGVDVVIPETTKDLSSGHVWTEGTHHLEGAEALLYVRQRKGLAGGDLDRIKRQQNFLRAVMHKTMSTGTLTNPIKLKDLLNAVADNTTVDDDFSAGKMRDLATSLRSLRGKDVFYMTAPMSSFADIEGVGSVILLDEQQNKALWKSVAEDHVQSYIDTYNVPQLSDTVD